MRKKLLLFIIISIAIIATIIIYYSKKENEIYYIALGDGIALGETPYNSYGYSYPDYIKDYLEANNILKFYTKEFAKEDLRIDDLITLFEKDETIEIDNKKLSINEAVNKANLITLSIGTSDLYYKLKINNTYLLESDIKTVMNEVDDIFNRLENCIDYIRKVYKKDLYVIGYYNPITSSNYINNQILDQIFDYTDKLFSDLSNKYNFIFININDTVGKSEELIPNPNNVHLNYKGYRAIGYKVINRFTF